MTSSNRPLDLTLRSGLRFIAGEPGTFMPTPPVVDELGQLGLIRSCGDDDGVSVGMSANRRLTDAGKLALGWQSYARIRVLQPGETPWQRRENPGTFEGPYIADGADAALDELARECGEPRMGHRAVQDYWVRDVDGDQEIWLALAECDD